MPPPRYGRHSAIEAFLDHPRIDALLRPLVPDAADRAYVLRCLLEEGPAHHRGTNWILLALLGEVVAKLQPPPAPPGPTVAVPLRLPPHLARGGDDDAFPLSLPTAPLEQLAPGDPAAQRAMIDCLTDGPPHHALANAAMVALLGQLLAAPGSGS